MNHFLKLVNFEFNRFFKLYLVLIGITIVSQIIGVIVESGLYLNRANQLIYKELMPKSEFIEQYGAFSFSKITGTLWFAGPIGLCVVALLIYVFFIWYRDWLGKNTFIYRLLMLPTARINLYFAKVATILLLMLGLVALQLLLLPIESQILQWMVPSEFRTDFSVYEITSIDYLAIFFPHSFIDFILYYGIGMIAVFIAFTVILFERAYRVKGIIYGIIYCCLSIVIIIAPLLIDNFILKNYFYTIELFMMELAAGLIALAIAIWLGHFLINKKVRV